MDFGRLYALFIAKLYSGGLETITTIFILIVIILVLEVRRVHRLYRSAITRHTTERNTWRESIEKIQDSFLKRNDEAMKSLIEQQNLRNASDKEIKELLSNLIVYLTNRK